jgi:hypothetical protein
MALEIGLEHTLPASDLVAVVQPSSSPGVEQEPERAVLDWVGMPTM